MITPFLLAVLAAASAPVVDAPAEVRNILVAVTDDKGNPVRDLTRDEVAVVEDGVARAPLSLVADERPLRLALLVDTSVASGSMLRLNLIEAVSGFLHRLPAGTRYVLWASGERPRKLVELTEDPTLAAPALRRVAPSGGSVLLDALVEAAEELKAQEGQRQALVAVTGLGPEVSYRDRNTVVERVRGGGVQVMSVAFDDRSADFETRQSAEYVLSRLAEATGGRWETTLSAMSVGSRLLSLAADLDAQYRLSYSRLSDAKPRKLELSVARPGVRVRLAGTPQ